MKRIKNFETFINEAEETEDKDFAHLPRLRTVVDKEFFNELKQHVFYWFNYFSLNKKYEMESVEATDNEVTVWFSDKEKLPTYQYKVTFTVIEEKAMIEKVEEVNMLIWIYDFETQELVKQTEMKISLKYINAKALNNFVNKVKKRIIRTPKDGEDVKNFKKKEKRRLSDNIY